ncbi:ralA-binding protein 1 isoform X2 [Lucilia sericata]|uniref:ralA-binding protein 1 isoform X2 n=1 Tax=Lucilia sericata TaxID=13632 RepID=UPI0018A7E9AA|nr:ralA-binding protein 1 isoform X2 [Lucilia sericata]
MELDSPDVEKEFPGLYASEGVEGGKSKKNKDESDYSEGDHDKVSKKDLLIGRRKDKKDKSKDRGYAALEGESSPEEELDANPSKSKKSKAFKFTSSKSKDKREKSRDKEKLDKDQKDEEKIKEKGDKSDKDKHGEKEKDKEKDKDKEHKKKDKDKKDKDKKDKSKDKDKEKDRKDKKDKAKQQTSISSEEVLELGSPVFGVSVSLATERSRCHDGIELPLVVRDCIDYLQEYGLKSEQIYRVEPMKTRLLHFKRLYNSRERQPETDVLDIPTACGLLKLFIKELPEPILTTDLIARFEEVASHPQVTKQQEELEQLLEQLPSCNKVLLSWILIHFDSVIQQEKSNKMNAQSLAMLLSPPLQMSHRLLVTLLCHCSTLFADIKLVKYVPPLTSSSPKLPDTPEEIQKELRKQDSLLNQIHSEMNAGFVSKKREEQLWEVQRIITQLKRKLKTFEKKQEKSIEELEASTTSLSTDVTDSATKIGKNLGAEDETNAVTKVAAEQNEQNSANDLRYNAQDFVNEPKDDAITINNNTNISPSFTTNIQETDGLYLDEDTGLLMVAQTHPDYATLLRLQLENQELLAWKTQLQTRISSERAEILRLKQLQQQMANKLAHQNGGTNNTQNAPPPPEGDYERIVEHFIRENALLEHKRQMLAKEIFEENKQCIAYQVELAMQKF